MSITKSYFNLILASRGKSTIHENFIYGLDKTFKGPEEQNIFEAIGATDLTDYKHDYRDVFKGFQTQQLYYNHHLGRAYGSKLFSIDIINQLGNLGFQMISHTVNHDNMHYWHLQKVKS